MTDDIWVVRTCRPDRLAPIGGSDTVSRLSHGRYFPLLRSKRLGTSRHLLRSSHPSGMLSRRSSPMQASARHNDRRSFAVAGTTRQTPQFTIIEMVSLELRAEKRRGANPSLYRYCECSARTFICRTRRCLSSTRGRKERGILEWWRGSSHRFAHIVLI